VKNSDQQKSINVKNFHVERKARLYFTQNLAVMIKAGVPINQALESFLHSAKSKRLKSAVTDILARIDSGYSLRNALKGSHLVGRSTLTLIDMGEQSGKLAENLLVAAEQEEKERKLQAKVRGALIYPTFVIVLSGVVGVGVAWFLLPKLATTFVRLNADLPITTKMLLSAGNFLQTNGRWFVPLASGLLVLLIYIIFFAPKTRLLGQKIIYSTPGISRLLKEVEIARFGYLLGTLLESGLTITESLDMMSRSATSTRYKKLYVHLKHSFENGYSFKDGFKNYQKMNTFLPVELQQIIIAGESTGSLPEVLKSIGSSYEARADTTSQNLEALLEPILLVTVAIGVLFVAVSVILPIYQLVGGLGT
jgi:general secretion pathway protein F